jgi:hypothetical protein
LVRSVAARRRTPQRELIQLRSDDVIVLAEVTGVPTDQLFERLRPALVMAEG